jgi:hypothetical protein
MPAVNFKFSDQGFTNIDFDDVFVRKEFFLEGGLWGWGYGAGGRLGDNTVINKSSPVQTISGGANWKQVSSGNNHVAVIKSDGTLWLWGCSRCGMLGDNQIALSRSSPVQTVSSGANWKQVSASTSHTAAIKTDGTLWLWGYNFSGNLGNNSNTARSSPVQTVSSGTDWKQVSTGEFNTAAIKTDGTLWLWGAASKGTLGENSYGSRSSPVQTVSSGTNWKQVSLGDQFTAAIKTDGTLWLWGYGKYGALGNNSTINRSSPVQTVSSGTNWKQVAAGRQRFFTHTVAIKTDGTLWTWGINTGGRLGDNTTITRSSPVQTVSSGTNWKQVSAGVLTAAIKTDGTLWSWGEGKFGGLGNNDTINRSSPVQTVSSGTNWKQVSASCAGSTAIREECW